MSTKGYKMSQSHKDKISKAMKGRKVSSGFTGHKHSIISKNKISKSKSGQSLSEEHKLNIGNANRNKPNFRKKTNGCYKNSKGYIVVYSPDHPFHDSKKYVLEHRLVMEKKLGRYLTKVEEIHHINEIRSDNRIKNLILFCNKSDHIKFHRSKKN